MSSLGRPKTKIICTLGPSTASESVLENMVNNGMSIARLNMSHGSIEDHKSSIHLIRNVSKTLDIPIGILVDIPGAKYRTKLHSQEIIQLNSGDKLNLTSRDVMGEEGFVTVSPPGIHRDAALDSAILLDDGLVELRVIEISGEDVSCEVIRGGKITDRRGVVTPGRAPSQPYPDEKAKKALDFAANEKADFIALSTVTKESDIHKVREILNLHGSDAQIISKIERVQALDNFEGILEASDGIMVARGDMGVEVPLAQVPIIQKKLISECNYSGKPVITATQMMESMLRSPVPTRAEVTDVANAIYDGTDAIMLSGETSIGQFPEEAVKFMSEVATTTEESLPYESIIVEKRQYLKPETDDAISYDACQTAYQLNASLIVAFTESGGTAGRVSKYRPKSSILALTSTSKVQRLLTLRWGVNPVIVPKITNVDDFFAMGEEFAVKMNGLKSGDLIVLVAGLPIGVQGGTNLLRVLNI